MNVIDAKSTTMEGITFEIKNKHEMFVKRTDAMNQKIDQLLSDVSNMKENKQDKENFWEQRLEIQSQLDIVNADLDKKANQIGNLEHFIDKYVPIRIQQAIGETLKTVLTRNQQNKLENFEMEKYKKLNEDVLDDEVRTELITVTRKIVADLEELIEKFRKIAKSKGYKYDVKKR